MPNHVTTILHGPKAVLDSLKTDLSEFDFNTIIPFPEELDSLTAEFKVFDTQEEADAHQKDQEERNAKLPEFFRANYEGKTHAITAERHAELTEQYGFALDWYNWNTQHWGTKWNAYDIERRDDETLKFETAWAFPEPVIIALSMRFPDTELVLQYADEDAGYNYGEVSYKAGVLVDGGHEHLGRGTEEALQFAVPLAWGQTYEEYLAEREED